MVRRLVQIIVLLALVAGAGAQESERDQRDDFIENWHAERSEYRVLPVNTEDFRGRRIGIMPALGVFLGLPDGVGLSAGLLVSNQRDGRQPVFLSLGLEKGVKTELATLGFGWGGVHQLPVAGQRMGFYGTSLRLIGGRDQDRESLWGIALGTEVAAGHLSVDFELGALDGPGQDPALILKIRGRLVRPMLFGAKRRQSDR